LLDTAGLAGVVEPGDVAVRFDGPYAPGRMFSFLIRE
jgi:hypothetical protein